MMGEDDLKKGAAALREILQRASAEKLQKTFFLASREERKGRLRAIMRLSVELERVKAETMFATALGEEVIEEIIEGDWEDALKLATEIGIEDEKWRRRTGQAPRWAVFVEIVRIECAFAAKRASGAGYRKAD
jgi:hypothetical protein